MISRILMMVAVLALSAVAQEDQGEKFTRPLGFPLIETSVEDVQLVMGEAPVTEEDHHVDVICYSWPDSGVVITFWSQGEGLTGGFSIQVLDAEQQLDCAEFSAKIDPKRRLEFGGLRLGDSKAEMKRILNAETVESENIIKAEYDRVETVQHPSWGPSPLHVNIYITGQFEDDKLVKLSISKSAST